MWRPGAPSPTASTLDDKVDDKLIVHVLNRIAFGPRQGDVEGVRGIGVDRFIDQQLHPERLADSGMAARLSGLASIGLSSREIAEVYELPQLEARRERKQEAKAGQGEPSKPDPLQQKANGVIVTTMPASRK